MKKADLLFTKAVFSFLLVLSSACSSAAASELPDQWSKLGRGLNNVVLFPLEVFYRPHEMHEQGESWQIAVAGGAFKGLGYAVARLGVGVYEVLTFPKPTAAGDYKPILLPEHMILSN